jgi:hypothetical protein
VGCRSPPWRCCWDAFCLVSVFQVKTFLRFFGGATMAGAASFPSWGRRFGRHVTCFAGGLA